MRRPGANLVYFADWIALKSDADFRNTDLSARPRCGHEATESIRRRANLRRSSSAGAGDKEIRAMNPVNDRLTIGQRKGRRIFGLSALAALLLAGILPVLGLDDFQRGRGQGGPVQEPVPEPLKFQYMGPASAGRILRGWSARRHHHLLCRRRFRRNLEIHRQRQDLRAHLRRPAGAGHRRAGRRAVGSEDRVGRERARPGRSATPMSRVTASTSRRMPAPPGKTWGSPTPAASAASSSIPKDPNIVFACALGRTTGPQEERGVYRTTDGGATWQRVLFVNPDTGCSGLAMDANDPNVLLAGTWQVVMHTWAMFSGGEGSGLYLTRDGGTPGKRLEHPGLPKSPVGKIDVAIAPVRFQAHVRADSDQCPGIALAFRRLRALHGAS